MNEKDLKYANLFGNNPGISIEERFRVMTEIEKLGGLTFRITTTEEGWVGECNEVPTIVTGNTNPNPTPIEIESQIRDAIYAAFNVKIEKAPETRRAILSPIQKADVFEYKFNSQMDGQ